MWCLTSMNSSTRSLLSGLEYKMPEIRELYRVLEIEDPGASEHRELDNILQHFDRPVIIVSIGITVACFIIQRRSQRRFDVLKISSSYSYATMGLGALLREILSECRLRDFVPQPILRKIVVIGDIVGDGARGTVWTLVRARRYTNEYMSTLIDIDRDESTLLEDHLIIGDVLREMKVVSEDARDKD